MYTILTIKINRQFPIGTQPTINNKTEQIILACPKIVITVKSKHGLWFVK